MEMTTIAISKEELEKLEEFKVHPSQPIREVIDMLIEDKEREKVIEQIIKDHEKLCIALSDSKGKRKR